MVAPSFCGEAGAPLFDPVGVASPPLPVLDPESCWGGLHPSPAGEEGGAPPAPSPWVPLGAEGFEVGGEGPGLLLLVVGASPPLFVLVGGVGLLGGLEPPWGCVGGAPG